MKLNQDRCFGTEKRVLDDRINKLDIFSTQPFPEIKKSTNLTHELI